MTFVCDDEVHAVGVRNGIKKRGIQHSRLNKWKGLRFVAESRCTVIAEENRFLAKEEKVQIVVVIVIEPNRFCVATLRNRDRRFFKLALAIDPKLGTRFGNDRQVRQSIVVKV